MELTKEPVMKRGNILLEAHKIINGERQDTYGKPEDSFQIIADYWTTYLGMMEMPITLTPKDVAIMMALFKIARIAGSNDADSFRDCAGYLGLGHDLSKEEL